MECCQEWFELLIRPARDFAASVTLAFQALPCYPGGRSVEDSSHICKVFECALSEHRCRRGSDQWLRANVGVFGHRTGTDKGSPTLTLRYVPGASGSQDNARHFHLCGCWHSCRSCRLFLQSHLNLNSVVGQGARRDPLTCVMECSQEWLELLYDPLGTLQHL